MVLTDGSSDHREPMAQSTENNPSIDSPVTRGYAQTASDNYHVFTEQCKFFYPPLPLMLVIIFSLLAPRR